MDFGFCINMRNIIPIGVLFLVATGVSFTAADPASNLHGHPERNEICSEHIKLHQRLDTIQESVEKTVEYLYSEVNSLVENIAGASWALPSSPGVPIVDIFEDDSR
ncbi:placenta-specific protein 9 [Bombina bombina]|uniref:placenta-specific protein 9 n=1 Tax=Bombina bombina TaxID=8345 RepID=UPI00235AE2B2|nr:placenta-specific protein 9 [Bombina bombina]